MGVHILELSKFNKPIAELKTALDRWLFFLRHAQMLDADTLPGPLNVPEVRWALGDLLMISQNERDREIYESRLKMRRDLSAWVAEAKGLARGEAIGEARGEAKGQVARIHSYQRLLRQHPTPPEQLQPMSLGELESLAARLEAELSAKMGDGS